MGYRRHPTDLYVFSLNIFSKNPHTQQLSWRKCFKTTLDLHTLYLSISMSCCCFQELRGYMLKHGGRVENYFSRNRVTHIVCSNLPDSKIRNLRFSSIVFFQELFFFFFYGIGEVVKIVAGGWFSSFGCVCFVHLFKVSLKVASIIHIV